MRISKRIKQLGAEIFMQRLAKYKGKAKINLDDKKLHKNREEIVSKYLKKFKRL